MKHHFFKKILLILSLLISMNASAQSSGKYLVLGVISSSNPAESIALLKDTSSKRTFAVKAGTKVDKRHELVRLTRKYVYMKISGTMTRIRVGESAGESESSYNSSTKIGGTGPLEGMEVEGNTVRVTGELRNHLVKQELSMILMQAAAVPHYDNGSLIGFRLWEIEADSIYEKTGFKNGDIITRIEGNELTDVSMTVKMLHALKNASSAEIVLIRDRKEQTLNIIVE
jgi:general secretion pathway protein C